MYKERSDKKTLWLLNGCWKNKEHSEKNALSKNELGIRKLVGICCAIVATMALMTMTACSDGKELEGNSIQKQAEDGAVLSNDWKNTLNQGIIQQEDIQKIVFLDLREKSDASMDNAIDEICYPKDMEESVEGSDDIYMWTESVEGKYILYVAAEGGVWAPKDCGNLFSQWENLEEIEFGKAFHVENVTNMSMMFSGCNKLRTLDISGFDTSQVTDMQYMFSECSDLVNINMSGFDTKQVTNMSYMFAGCSSLENLDVSSFDTGNVIDFGGMFKTCSKLVELDVTGFHTEKATDMRFMFSECSELTKLDVSGFETSHIKYDGMSHMFSYCAKLETVGDIGVPEDADPYGSMYISTPMYQR